jgi:hypothetical protein
VTRIANSVDAIRRVAPLAALAAAALALTSVPPAEAGILSAPIPPSHGQLLRLAPVGTTINATQSSNWIGYDQGSLEQGGKLFTSITGRWIVPRATPRVSGQAASSSVWIGIGGGCVDSGCAVTDATLIQTGTEQDVSAGGADTYSAWWEAIPAPSAPITSITVSPGDRMSASIAEVVPESNLWTITLNDLTNHESYTTSVPYASTHATAEWIEENPLIIGTNSAAFSTLPNLTSPAFDLATTNGAPVELTSSEAMDLVDSNGNVIGAPSAPDAEADGFDVCAWASTCTAATATGSPSTTSTGSPTSAHRTTVHCSRKRHTTAKAGRKKRRTRKRKAGAVNRAPRCSTSTR